MKTVNTVFAILIIVFGMFMTVCGGMFSFPNELNTGPLGIFFVLSGICTVWLGMGLKKHWFESGSHALKNSLILIVILLLIFLLYSLNTHYLFFIP